MTDGFTRFVGIDWATEEHDVCALHSAGKTVGVRSFKHRGDDLSVPTAWLRDKAILGRSPSPSRCPTVPSSRRCSRKA